MVVAKKMKQAGWYCPELNLDGYAKKELQGEIERYISENKRRVYLEWENNEYEKLEKMVKFGSMLLSYHVEDEIDCIDKKLLFELGTLKGITECFEHLLYERGQQMRVEEKIHIATLSVKYFNEVIDFLQMFKRVTHTELCELLHLKPSTLTEAMKKILETEMVQAVFAGKYKIYSLTDAGLRYAKMKNRKLKAQRGKPADILTATLWAAPVTERVGNESGSAPRIANVIDLLPGDRIELHPKNSSVLVSNIFTESSKEGEEKKFFSVETLNKVNRLESKTDGTLDNINNIVA